MARGSALLHQEDQFIKGLLGQQKAIIILNLGNTILHSMDLSSMALEQVLQLQESYLIRKLEPSSMSRPRLSIFARITLWSI